MKKIICCCSFLLLSSCQLLAMDAHAENLKKELMPYKARILGIMTSRLDRPLDFNPTGKKVLGTINPQKKTFSYGEADERKSLDFNQLEELLQSDDEEFNIADMYDGMITPREDNSSESDSLTDKKPEKKPCYKCGVM